MSSKHSKPTPNEQRSDVKNPNNPAHKDAADHRSRQLNPADPQSQGPREPPPPAPGKNL
jgi:hypothetical protein